eukprot:560781-Pleurochrysis_carterae.AAC.1
MLDDADAEAAAAAAAATTSPTRSRSAQRGAHGLCFLLFTHAPRRRCVYGRDLTVCDYAGAVFES